MAGWKAYLDNDAVEFLSLKEGAEVRKRLARDGKLDKIMKPRFVLVDKHEPLRTESHHLPVKASARLVVPGYKDHSNLKGNLRRDAFTGCRVAQHLLFSIAAFHTSWDIVSGDVKAAFLKGDEFVNVRRAPGTTFPCRWSMDSWPESGMESLASPTARGCGGFVCRDAWPSTGGSVLNLMRRCGSGGGLTRMAVESRRASWWPTSCWPATVTLSAFDKVGAELGFGSVEKRKADPPRRGRDHPALHGRVPHQLEGGDFGETWTPH